MDWTTACPDWEERLLAGQSLVPMPPLYPERAEEALAVLRSLRIVDAPGSPPIGDACRSWVFDFAGAVFGAYDQDTGRQLIREAFLLISKKNSKSTLAAAIMLTALILNWRESAEFLILAPTLEIAQNSFVPASDMVAKSPELAALLHVSPFHRTIRHRTTNATLKVVAADNDTVSGKKATAVLVDELWLFGKRPNAENMLREATGGLAARPEGFVIYLSTQSDEAPAGVFRQKLQYFRGVRDGRIQDRRALPILYEWPDRMLLDKSYRDPTLFYVTNPNLGASVDEEFLRDEFRKAQEAGEDSVRGFLAKHLNVEIGLALRSDRWRGADHWEKRGGKVLSLGDLLRRSDVVTVGIDGGGLDDLLGLAVLGRERETRRWLHWGRAWVARSVLDLRKDIAPRLLDFERDGTLALVEDGTGEDVSAVADVVQQIAEAGLLPEKHGIGVDPAGIADIVDELAQRGFVATDDGNGCVVGVSQGWRLSNMIKTCERRLAAGDLVHEGSALMAWSVGNAKVEPRGNALSITKQAAGSAKIDPLIALFAAASLMALNPQVQSRSFWEAA